MNVLPRWRSLDALAGLLAFAMAAAFAELIAALFIVVSPYIAVGDAVIRLAPVGAVRFAISTFGTYDKPVLLGVIALITSGKTISHGSQPYCGNRFVQAYSSHASRAVATARNSVAGL